MRFDRFMNVARWNLTVNRSQYLKLALGLFLFMSLPFLLFVVRSIWTLSFYRSTPLALASIPGDGMVAWMWTCFLFAMPILCGYTFHNLLTKQSRIKELTLPATNGEKFLFHAIVTVGGALLTYVVSFLVINLLQYLTVGVIYGFSNANWLPVNPLLFTLTDDELIIKGWVQLFAVLSWVAYFSTFVLGNALKYRHNVIWTFLFHWALSFVMMIILGIVSADLLNSDMRWLWEMDETQIKYIVKAFFIGIPSIVIVFCWWMSYRLYTRAQITTRRNK